MTVIGTGTGESILLEIGSEVLVIVDCCRAAATVGPRNRTMSALNNVLKRSPDARIAALLVTHPHTDHFAGVDSLIRRHQRRIERVFFFNAITEVELAEILRDDEDNARRGESAYRSFAQFKKVLRCYTDDLDANKQASAADATTLAQGSIKGYRYVVECLSPSPADSRRFLAQARIAGLVGPSSLSRRHRQECNDVSVVLRVELALPASS